MTESTTDELLDDKGRRIVWGVFSSGVVKDAVQPPLGPVQIFESVWPPELDGDAPDHTSGADPVS